jgi:recombination protein RecR
LGIKQLIQQINNDAIEEVILVTNSTIEGDSTAFLIREMLKGVDVKLTRIAQGVPLGGELEMVDTGTIQHAFKGRQIF